MAGNRHHRAEHQERDMFSAPSPDDPDSPYPKRPKAPPKKAPPEKEPEEKAPEVKKPDTFGSYAETPANKVRRYNRIIDETVGGRPPPPPPPKKKPN